MLDRMKVLPSPISNAFRFLEPTWRNYVFYANAAAANGDELMKKVIASYNALPPGERTRRMPEEICDLAGVDPAELIASVSKEVWRHKQGESAITAAMTHPRVLEATARYAQGQYGEKDRELFFRLTGGLPDKKGTSIVINTNPQTANVTNHSPLGSNGYRSMDQRVIEMGKLLDDPAHDDVPSALADTNSQDADVLGEDNESED